MMNTVHLHPQSREKVPNEIYIPYYRCGCVMLLLAEVSLVPVAAHALPEVAELRNTAEVSGYPVIEESLDGSLYIYNPQEPVDCITQEQVPDEWISAVPSESETAKYVASEVGGPRGDASGVRDAIAGSGGVTSAGKSPYHYHFNVVIWRDGSGSSAKARAHFRALSKNMKKTFPFRRYAAHG